MLEGTKKRENNIPIPVFSLTIYNESPSIF
jgi:hypothetical protein